ncbi:DUF1206 domain-containing protein [Pseudonocardia hydrocarbonoxydans]|uniref:DUF1206 domain-containing protein n=1 Tax=Pseudonocardia hydrocarbonoxydans TaxID=76726 RepID=UPI0014777EFF|nr:DUF1206 domain-containing protein [Pseudonocardia hydrocarbonoxydans]
MTGPLVRLRRLVRSGPSDAPGPLVDALGRVGLVGYGLVHLLVAWLALQVAFGVPDAPADPDGAIGTVARTPGGFATLALAAVGLAAFAVWQLSAAALGFRWVHGGERFRKRVGAVAKAIATGGLALVVVDYLLGVRRPGGDTAVRTLAATALGLPYGRLLLGAAAVGVLALAVAMTYTGVRRTFLGDLDLRGVGPVARAVVVWLGVAGHLSRALALGMIGVLAGSAALSADPGRAGGLDAALRALGSSAAGAGLLVTVAAGIAAFGLFCLADAATRRA